MLIKNVESKIKFVTVIAISVMVAAVIISISSIAYAMNMVDKSQQNVYVLDNGIPLLIKRTNIDINRPAEYKSHVSMFHYLFFNLPPDKKFIEKSMETAMYLIDETGLLEYNNLKEKGYYNQILASSAVLNIRTDSIVLSGVDGKDFHYYGTQRIDRKTSIITRAIETTGRLKDIPRSDNNPHGVIIEDWRTILNNDIERREKKNF